MKTNTITPARVVACIVLVLAATGCSRGSRGNPDAQEKNRAATPAEGGATLTTGSAGESKNFGDTRTTTQVEGRSPSASPTGLSKDTTAQPAVQTPTTVTPTGQQPSQNVQTPQNAPAAEGTQTQRPQVPPSTSPPPDAPK